MVEADDQEILANVRALLALERNYLAEERTALAEFRTGLALALLAPTASTVAAYVLTVLEVGGTPLFDLFSFIFFAILTFVGVWISFHSRSKLKKISKKKKALKDRQAAVIRSSKAVHDLLGDFISLEDR